MKFYAVIGTLVACGSTPPLTRQLPVPQVPAVQPAGAPASASVQVVSVEPVQVVRFVRNTALHGRPDMSAPDIGTIGRNARAAVLSEAPASSGCATRWLQISPRGWTCDTATLPSERLPSMAPASSLADDDPTPPVTGVYGIVRKDTAAFESAAAITSGEGRPLLGKNSIRAVGAITLDGKRYWRTSGGELIDTAAIVGMEPSRFRGVAIADSDHMPAWIRVADRPVIARAGPNSLAPISRKLRSRTVVAIRTTSNDGRFVEIDDHVWVARRDVRIATQAPAPQGTGDDEKWFDIDLDEQVLVAYQGARPVYATLVSTGRRDHATPALITRIAHKLERTTMASNQTDVYSVADVPWTMFYDRDYALHTAYWHDGFGSPRSHGCINLAPYDARLLFRWSSPDVPPGWIAVRGDVEHPGSLVRIHSRYAPEPEYRGYARELHELAGHSSTHSTDVATK